MTHAELLFYKLYPQAMRITAKDEHLGVYVYLCKNEDDTNDLLSHLMQSFGKHAVIECGHLWEEV